LNVSTRGNVLSGDDNLIAGFIITGTEPKRVVLRAIGPFLSVAGVSGALSNPVLHLFNSSNLEIATNDDWQSDPGVGEIRALGLGPNLASEAATVQNIAPGSYTVMVSGKDASKGVALAEVYDLTPKTNSVLANISTRGSIGLNDNILIGGFIIGGAGSAKVIIRAIGPSLSVQGKIADPTLELHDSNGALLEANDNWVDSPNKQAIIDSTIPPTNDLESAIVRTLPGNAAGYTAIVRGVYNTTGIAVVEVYALQ
jgi:hypothetical protein